MAQAVYGGDAHAGGGSRDTTGLRRRGESLSQFHRRVPAEGAEHQLIGSGLSQEQQVDRPALDAAGLAGTGSRHYQQWAVGMADDLPLPGVELRAQASYHRCDGHGSPWFPGWLGEDVVRGTGVRLQAMTGIPSGKPAEGPAVVCPVLGAGIQMPEELAISLAGVWLTFGQIDSPVVVCSRVDVLHHQLAHVLDVEGGGA